MQPTAFIDWRSIFSALDFWAFRYQSAFVGIIALSIAFQQLGIARKQSLISREQFKMAAAQRATDQALAEITVDRLLVPAHRALSLNIGRGFYWDSGNKDSEGWTIWNWDPSALDEVASLEVPADFDAAAAKAFPDHAPLLVQMKLAIEDAKKLKADFEADPWQRDVMGAVLSPREQMKAREVDDAMNRLFKFAMQCSKIQPHIRAQDQSE